MMNGYIDPNEIASRPAKKPTIQYTLSHKELASFGAQIATGMAHLERCGVVHRDLAARNVLLSSHKVLKISDFGLSRIGNYVNFQRVLLPMRWMAPESFVKPRKHTSKSDVWSFGVVLWEIGTLGGLPYDGIPDQDVIPFIQKGGKLDKPESVTQSLYELMLQCWQFEDEERPSFEEIVSLICEMTSVSNVYVDFQQLKSDYIFPKASED